MMLDHCDSFSTHHRNKTTSTELDLQYKEETYISACQIKIIVSDFDESPSPFQKSLDSDLAKKNACKSYDSVVPSDIDLNVETPLPAIDGDCGVSFSNRVQPLPFEDGENRQISKKCHSETHQPIFVDKESSLTVHTDALESSTNTIEKGNEENFCMDLHESCTVLDTEIIIPKLEEDDEDLEH